MDSTSSCMHTYVVRTYRAIDVRAGARGAHGIGDGGGDGGPVGLGTVPGHGQRWECGARLGTVLVQRAPSDGRGANIANWGEMRADWRQEPVRGMLPGRARGTVLGVGGQHPCRRESRGVEGRVTDHGGPARAVLAGGQPKAEGGYRDWRAKDSGN